MTISTLKELQGLIRLCKKLGVHTMKVDGIEFIVALDNPAKSNKTMTEATNEIFPEAQLKVPRYTPVPDTSPPQIKTDELTEEQMLMWSSRPEETAEQQ